MQISANLIASNAVAREETIHQAFNFFADHFTERLWKAKYGSRCLQSNPMAPEESGKV